MATVKQGIYTNEFFNLYLKNDIMTAQVIAKNLFCKVPSDIKLFNSYFSFCTGVIDKKTDCTLEECQYFLAEAELALRIFSEKCEITKMSLKVIDKCNETIQKKIDIINELINEQQKKQELEATKLNNQFFNDLCRKIHQLYSCYSDKLAEEIASLDNKLNKELFSKDQIKQYKIQSERLSGIVARRIREQNVSYNKIALESYEDALKKFISDSAYKKEKERGRLQWLLKDKLFDYKQEILFPETLVYYNYVYSYIFSKLDNEGKKFMTKCAIENKK